MNEDLSIGAGAKFSEDRAYRFCLYRIWDLSKPMVMLIGLNPSTANETKSDPTIRRLQGSDGLIASNGYGGFYMMNLYPFVTPYPKVLETAKDKLPENDLFLKTISYKCGSIIFCWGNFKTYGRDREVMNMFPSALCFGKNASGSPKHPLYLKGNTKLINFNTNG